MKVVVLVSGGLDSLLTYHWCRNAGFECFPVHFRNPFTKGIDLALERIQYFDLGFDFIEVVRHPAHGRGKNMNPCIDCRIMMLVRAKGYMDRLGAECIVTGEVLGQRPMSQFLHTLLTIDRAAGLEGKVLRPLSGKKLPPTEMERKGLVQREQLSDLQGRSRKGQLAMARQYGLTDYLAPAGGCLLTDRNFSNRLKALLAAKSEVDLDEIEMLKVGRHFRFDDQAWLIVGRNETENQRLEGLARQGDWLLQVQDLGSPTSLLRGDRSYLVRAAELTKRYSDGRNRPSVEVECRLKEPTGFQTLIVSV